MRAVRDFPIFSAKEIFPPTYFDFVQFPLNLNEANLSVPGRNRFLRLSLIKIGPHIMLATENEGNMEEESRRRNEVGKKREGKRRRKREGKRRRRRRRRRRKYERRENYQKGGFGNM